MTNADSTMLLAQKRKLNKLARLFTCIPLIFSLIGIVAIYNFQDFISPLFGSNDLCEDRNFRNASLWLLPKITSHCELVTSDALKDHPSADIAIFLDVFVALFFVIYLLILAVYYGICAKYYLAVVQDKIKNFSSDKLALLYLAGIPVVLYSTYFTFISSDLVSYETSGISKMSAMFSSQYGVGAALHIVHASAGPVLFCALALILRAYNTLIATSRSEKT